MWHGIDNVMGGTKAATGGNGVIASAMWTYVVVTAIVLPVVERRHRRAGHPSIRVPREHGYLHEVLDHSLASSARAVAATSSASARLRMWNEMRSIVPVNGNGAS